MKAQKNSRRSRAKKSQTRVISGDQNSVERVDSGGIVFQSGKHHIEIIQHFGGPIVSATEQDLLRSPTISTDYFEPQTIYIPEGTFWMGSDAGEGIPSHETPQHEVYLPAYRIGKYPVNNAQYELFIHKTGRLVAPIMGWNGQTVPKGLENHPVTGVTWFEALAYCQWLSEKTKRSYILPNEAQWEKACRGGSKSIYPWGDEFDPTRCNHDQPDITPVNKYPAQNEFGCFDLVGNIRQWTCTLWGEKRTAPDLKYAYPWKDDGRNDLNASREIYRVVRGSTGEQNLNSHRCSARRAEAPELRGRTGFRIAMSV